jgi:hypothetical protein
VCVAGQGCTRRSRGPRGPRQSWPHADRGRDALVLVEVERLPGGERRREPRVLCGCGGTLSRGSPPQRTSASCGGPTRGASSRSTRFASSSRVWDGPPLGCAIPSRPTAGGGWWLPLTRRLEAGTLVRGRA